MILYILVCNYGDIEMEEYEELINELHNMKQELLLLKKYIDRISNFLYIVKNNRTKVREIMHLKSQMSIEIFNKDKRKSTKEAINNLEKEIIPINVDEEKRSIKKGFEEEVVSQYNEYKDVNELFKSISVIDMFNILEDIYKNKAQNYNSMIDKYFELQNKMYNNHLKILK